VRDFCITCPISRGAKESGGKLEESTRITGDRLIADPLFSNIHNLISSGLLAHLDNVFRPHHHVRCSHRRARGAGSVRPRRKTLSGTERQGEGMRCSPVTPLRGTETWCFLFSHYFFPWGAGSSLSSSGSVQLLSCCSGLKSQRRDPASVVLNLLLTCICGRVTSLLSRYSNERR
jgi:hypothetical protein